MTDRPQGTDALDDFDHRRLTFGDGTGEDTTGDDTAGTTRTTHVGGTGPAVVVLTEMPGITPEVARFARSIPLDDPDTTFVCDDDLVAVRERLDADDLTVRAYRSRVIPSARRAGSRPSSGPSATASSPGSSPTTPRPRAGGRACPTAWSPPTSSTRPASPPHRPATRSSRSSPNDSLSEPARPDGRAARPPLRVASLHDRHGRPEGDEVGTTCVHRVEPAGEPAAPHVHPPVEAVGRAGRRRSTCPTPGRR